MSGKYSVSTHKKTGEHVSQTKFLNGHELMMGGYETIFNQDFNNDGIFGFPPETDADPPDGFIDHIGWKYFKVVYDSKNFIADKDGRKYLLDPRSWRQSIPTNVLKINGKYKVLHAGLDNGKLKGKYKVTTHDLNGAFVSSTKFMNGQKMMEAGYEPVFQKDFNLDTHTRTPDTTDSDGDGFVDERDWKAYRVYDPSNSSPFVVDSKGHRYKYRNNRRSWRYSELRKVVTTEISQQFEEDFSSGQPGNLWESISGAEGVNSRFNNSSQALFFGYVGNSGTSRQATTIAINATPVGKINFDFIYGTDHNGGEEVDANEEVVLEYSTDGNNFTRFGKLNLSPNRPNWKSHSINMPQGVTSSTSFRWRQLSHHGGIYDHWAIDNISITSNQSGRQILIEGTDKYSGRYRVLTNSIDGQFVGQTDWLSGFEMMDQGYETVFNMDFNKDTITGKPSIVDSEPNGPNGIVDDPKSSWEYFRIFDTSNGHPIIRDELNRKIPTVLQGWRKYRPIEAIKNQATSTYQVLHEGFGDESGKFYVITSDYQGLHIDSTGKRSGQFFTDSGYESVFGYDLNGDGI